MKTTHGEMWSPVTYKEIKPDAWWMETLFGAFMGICLMAALMGAL